MLPSENNSTPPSDQPAGDLEFLFRQKFAEAEVPPRASLWEQLDHDLVVGQNETYRRRLAAYRWTAAASVLLLLSFGSWFGWHYGTTSGGLPELVATMPSATSPAGQLSTAQDASSEQLALDQSMAEAGAAMGAAGADAASAEPYRVGAGLAGADVSASAGASPLASGIVKNSAAANRAVSSPGTPRNVGSDFASAALSRGSVSAAATAGTTQFASLSGNGLPAGSFGTGAARAGYGTGLAAPASSSAMTELAARMAALPGRLGYGRPAVLPQTAVTVASLTTSHDAEEQKDKTASRSRRWRLLGSYAASAYNPNMNFSEVQPGMVMAAVVSPTVQSRGGSNSYELAAAEYRQNLRAGLSQRATLTAGYAANKHWTLMAGLEVAEQRASSRTSYGFLDGKHTALDVNPSNSPYAMQPAQMRTTSYRYRTAGIPVGARYGSAKPGVSIYAKVGAVVNVLLNSRSELEGVPEATRVYTLNSVDSPYRRVQVAARGGAGARYQPANASWSVAVGPTAEGGITTVNAGPSQTLMTRSRPYSVGLEASVEFGSKPVLVP